MFMIIKQKVYGTEIQDKNIVAFFSITPRYFLFFLSVAFE